MHPSPTLRRPLTQPPPGREPPARIGLQHVRFDLRPAALRRADRDLGMLEEAWVETLTRLYGPDKRWRPRWSAQERLKIVAAAERARMGAEDYVVTCLSSWAKENPDRPFRAEWLTGERAVERAAYYRTAVNEACGYFTAEALENLLFGPEGATDPVARRLAKSERLFGRAVVALKLRRGGPPWETLYRHLEARLDPLWLALEPTYRDTVGLTGPDRLRGLSAEARPVREAAIRALLDLKGSRAQSLAKARRAFGQRGAVMPEAIAHVLSAFGRRPSDFRYPEGEVVHDAAQFWVRLGQALQHWLCWGVIDDRSGQPREWRWLVNDEDEEVLDFS